ncbi:MAG: hypothetical protein Q8M03_01050 [Legionella sp.]|nr:hypothetical protein [Legionella sp.]
MLPDIIVMLALVGASLIYVYRFRGEVRYSGLLHAQWAARFAARRALARSLYPPLSVRPMNWTPRVTTKAFAFPQMK